MKWLKNKVQGKFNILIDIMLACEIFQFISFVFEPIKYISAVASLFFTIYMISVIVDTVKDKNKGYSKTFVIIASMIITLIFVWDICTIIFR